MVWVPQGEFVMGADTADLDALWRRFDWPAAWRAGAVDEGPGHVVELDGFWLYRHEVTVAQYRRFCAATGQPMPPAPLWGWVEDHPVVNVSWEEAAAYCRWASVRLPSEAEWERAARGEHTGRGGRARRAFAFGDRLPERRARVGNVPDESYGRTYPDRLRFSGYEDGFVHPAPVGSFRPTAFGLHDMAGNAQEWCADWYAPYAPDRQVNPGGPATGKYRVCRGGSWGDTPSQIRVSDRNRDVPTTRYDGLGFRPARTAD
jgi:formylglycine-generating enzyme required for sulfatase activity